MVRDPRRRDVSRARGAEYAAGRRRFLHDGRPFHLVARRPRGYQNRRNAFIVYYIFIVSPTIVVITVTRRRSNLTVVHATKTNRDKTVVVREKRAVNRDGSSDRRHAPHHQDARRANRQLPPLFGRL